MRLLDISKEYALANRIILSIIMVFLVLPFIIIFVEQLNYHLLLSHAPKCFVKVHTGHLCPTCGLTRSILLLYEGNIKESLAQYTYGYLFVLILAIQLFIRSIPLLSHRVWIPYMDITQMILCGIIWVFITH